MGNYWRAVLYDKGIEAGQCIDHHDAVRQSHSPRYRGTARVRHARKASQANLPIAAHSSLVSEARSDAQQLPRFGTSAYGGRSPRPTMREHNRFDAESDSLEAQREAP